MGVCIVTGASRGIGKEIALTLAEEGHFVIINYSRDREGAELTEKAILDSGHSCRIFQADISNFEEAKALVDFTKKLCGRIDILINNAGVSHHGLLMDMDEDTFDFITDTNLKGTFNVTRHAMEHLLKTQGSIVNLSSIWSEAGASNEVVYAMTKAGINALTRSLAKEMAPSGVRVNAVAPGLIDTHMNDNLNEEEKNEITCYLASGRIGTAKDVANLVKFLVSDEGQYINGQIITVDGGYV